MLPLIQAGGGGGASGTFPSTIAKVTTKFLDSYSSITGLFTQTQPDFTDLSGTATTAQIPNLSATKITSGLLGLAQGGTGVDLSATGSATAILAQGAGHVISARALVGADLPNPSASTLGGIQSLAAVGSKWINTISTAGVPSATQPAFSDLNGSIANSQDAAVITAVDLGYFWSNGQFGIPQLGQSSAAIVASGNQAWCIQFVLTKAVTIGRATYARTATTGGTNASFGIYAAGAGGAPGTLQCSFTVATAAGGGATVSTTFTRVTLNPGVYWFAWTCDSAVPFFNGTTVPTQLTTYLNAQTNKKAGTGTATTSGALNGTFGTVAASAMPGQVMPLILWEFN